MLAAILAAALAAALPSCSQPSAGAPSAAATAWNRQGPTSELARAPQVLSPEPINRASHQELTGQVPAVEPAPESKIAEPEPAPPAEEPQHAPTEREQDVCDKMRQLVAYWLQSGEFEQVMVQANISTRSSNGDVGRLYELGKRLLQDCDPGTPWKDAPLACRETALALVLESAHAIQQHYEQIDNRYRELREGGTYERLRSVLTTGFEELSSGNVFLSHSDINQLARQKLQEAFPDEPKEVLEQLARDLGTHIETTARASRHAFRLYVRYIVFGTKGFGTRDRFAQYEDYEQCRAAIEKAINTMIDQHPKYRNADRSAGFVKQLVGKQASDLANAIHKKK